MTTLNKLEKLPWNGFGRVFVAITVVVGCAYAVAQWLKYEDIEDALFIGLLSANTFLIYKLVKQLRVQAENAAAHYEEELGDPHLLFTAEKFGRQVFGWHPAFFVGLVFGLIFFCTANFLAPWGDERSLNLFLSTFLLSANIVTGMAISSLAFYLRLSFLIGSNVKIDLWDRDRPSISAIVSTNRNILIVTALVSCIGITSILFSKFTFSIPVMTFSAFSILVILLTYLVPLIPLTAQIREKKAENINHIARLIEEEYRILHGSGSGDRIQLDISRFDSLKALYGSVESVREFPPVGGFSKNTAVSVAILTLMPTIIDFVLSSMS